MLTHFVEYVTFATRLDRYIALLLSDTRRQTVSLIMILFSLCAISESRQQIIQVEFRASLHYSVSIVSSVRLFAKHRGPSRYFETTKGW